MPASSLWRSAIFLALIFLIMAGLVSAWQLLAGRQLSAKLSSAGKVIKSELPMVVSTAGDFIVEVEHFFPKLHVSTLHIVPDNCLVELWINGVKYRGLNQPECNYRKGVHLSLHRYLHAGRNQLKFVIRNHGGPGGLSYSASLSDPLVWILLSFAALLLLVCLYYFTRCTSSAWGGMVDLYPSWSRSPWQVVALFIGAIGALRALTLLILGLQFELQDVYRPDAPLFWTMGRALINGLVPYADLYENKPPGIFLVSALSFRLFDNEYGTHIVQAAVLAGSAVLPIIYSFILNPALNWPASISVQLSALIYFALSAYYLGLCAGQVETESFGVLFSILYAIVFTSALKKTSWRYQLFSTLSLLLAIGFKEPFLLVCAGLALILSDSWWAFLRGFISPAAVALLSGSIVLWWLGWLTPYLEFGGEALKLDERMFGETPAWLEAFNIIRPLRDLYSFSPSLLTVLLIITVSVSFRGIIKAASLIEVVQKTLRVVLGVYLNLLAFGLGQHFDWRHYYAVPVATYVSLFLVYSWIYKSKRSLGQPIFTWVVMLLLVRASFEQPLAQRQLELAYQGSEIQVVRNVATEVDRILDQCNFDRFLMLARTNLQPSAFTRHSPYGPAFLQPFYWIDPRCPLLYGGFLRALTNAKVILLDQQTMLRDLSEEIRLIVQTYIQSNFKESTRACGARLQSSDRYKLLYRNE